MAEFKIDLIPIWDGIGDKYEEWRQTVNLWVQVTKRKPNKGMR